MIFDTHCHLNSDELFPNIDLYIKNAQEVGVKKILVVGYDKRTSFLAVEIAHKYECCYAAVGFHPTEIYDLKKEDWDELETLLKDDKVVAIGEIGLDYHWDKDETKKELQKEAFIKQINLANKYHFPVSIHNRDAMNDCLKILEKNKPLFGGIMHCYSGSVELVKRFIDLGFYISLGGPVTFKNAITPKEVAKLVPLNYLLVETDCPYLSPHPLRGQLNEPKNIKLIVEEIANLKSISSEEVANVTYENACRLLKIK